MGRRRGKAAESGAQAAAGPASEPACCSLAVSPSGNFVAVAYTSNLLIFDQKRWVQGVLGGGCS